MILEYRVFYRGSGIFVAPDRFNLVAVLAMASISALITGSGIKERTGMQSLG